MNIEINDREKTVIVASLELMRSVKQEQITNPEPGKPVSINEHDRLDAKHTLMHTLTLLAKLLNKPLEYFTKNPSQNAQPSEHPKPEPNVATAP
jgi:hypothetical protein